MALNQNRILLGGIAAGVVLNVIDAISNMVILADRMKAEAEAFKPGLSTMMTAPRSIIAYIISDFVIGLLLVWTYAAVRPRFGPGVRTAGAVGVLFWLFGSITTMGYLQMGMMSKSLWWTYGLIWLVNLVVAAIVGAWLYREGDEPA